MARAEDRLLVDAESGPQGSKGWAEIAGLHENVFDFVRGDLSCLDERSILRFDNGKKGGLETCCFGLGKDAIRVATTGRNPSYNPHI